MKMPLNAGSVSGPVTLGRSQTFGFGNERHKDKPGLAEIMALLQQFGPSAQVGQEMNETKLADMKAAMEYARSKGYPSLDAMQVGQQDQRQQQIETHQNQQDQRYDEAQASQSKLHDNANVLDFAKLASDPLMSSPQNKPLIDLVRKHLGIEDQQPLPPNVDPRLKKYTNPPTQ